MRAANRAVTREATPQERLGIMAGAIDWILTMQQQDAARETKDEAKKRAHRRYGDAVLALSKAYFACREYLDRLVNSPLSQPHPAQTSRLRCLLAMTGRFLKPAGGQQRPT